MLKKQKKPNGVGQIFLPPCDLRFTELQYELCNDAIKSMDL